MAAREHLNKEQFTSQLKMELFDNGELNATHPDHPYVYVGQMSWDPTTGEMRGVDVLPEFQRRGVATAMWNYAQANVNPSKQERPHHSATRTLSGNAWAKKVGGELPRRRRGSPDYED